MTLPTVTVTVTFPGCADGVLDLHSLHARMQTMSEKIDQITAQVAEQALKLGELQAAVDDKQAAIAAAIAALEAKIAASGADAELQAIIDALALNNAQLDDIEADVESTPVPADETPADPPADPPAEA